MENGTPVPFFISLDIDVVIYSEQSSDLPNSSLVFRFSAHSVFFPMFSFRRRVKETLLFRGQAGIALKLEFAH